MHPAAVTAQGRGLCAAFLLNKLGFTKVRESLSFVRQWLIFAANEFRSKAPDFRMNGQLMCFP